jgi:hypothetical protein
MEPGILEILALGVPYLTFSLFRYAHVKGFCVYRQRAFLCQLSEIFHIHFCFIVSPGFLSPNNKRKIEWKRRTRTLDANLLALDCNLFVLMLEKLNGGLIE